MKIILKGVIIFVLTSLSLVGFASIEPKKYIGAYVIPYYEAADSAEGTPRVAVAKKYDALLSSNDPKDILRVRDSIEREPGLITPMTLMVLAIRLYDLGYRDESVYWFYIAKNRFITFAEVADFRANQSLMQIFVTMRDFVSLAGRYINGYAFCDIEKQNKTQRKAFEWVKNNPYQAMFLPNIPAVPGDRKENLEKAVEGLYQGIQKEREQFEDAEVRAKFVASRKENNMDKMFCW
ncbi:MAG: cytochrome-c oxidase [Gammaproteobacteria bacterium]|nr:cytochrome-c oxidase [Gammaproteobacteria bacterium]